MVWPSMTAQHVAGSGDPTTVTDVSPTPTLVEVASPARSTAVTVVVAVKVSVALMPRPAMEQVKAMLVTPQAVVVELGRVDVADELVVGLGDGDGGGVLWLVVREVAAVAGGSVANASGPDPTARVGDVDAAAAVDGDWPAAKGDSGLGPAPLRV